MHRATVWRRSPGLRRQACTLHARLPASTQHEQLNSTLKENECCTWW